MIELYVILTLFGMGYLINQQKTIKGDAVHKPVSRELPNTNIVRHASDVESRKAAAMYKQSLQPQSKVINKNSKMVKSKLTGEWIDESKLTHNNMVPFFKRSTAPYKESGNIMESFGAVYNPDTMARKRERAPLFTPEMDLGSMQGSLKNEGEIFRERIVKPSIHNNVVPFCQERVGPGLDQGYTSLPTGGYQQFDIPQYVKPKGIDELRTVNNPKITFEGRVVDGQKGNKRGVMGKVDKNRSETFYENSSDRYMVTTGAYLRDKHRPCIDVKHTSRTDTAYNPYTGPAHQKIAYVSRGKVQNPLRDQLAGFEVANPSMTNVAQDGKDDYGKGSILIYANERDVTSTKTFQGNVASIVKAIVAPIQDVLKPAKKEYLVDAERQFGQMSAQIPEKPVVYDPNDVMRTTIKETTLQEAERINLKGASRVYVYNPDSVARTTVKETTVHNSDNLNLKGGALKSIVYDPNDIARTTIKETNLQPSEVTNIKTSRSVGIAYDPNDIARTTLKELMLHDADWTNIVPGPSRGAVYDDTPAKTTGRETLETIESTLNMISMRRALPVHDPNDKARTTIKETVVHDVRDGNIDALSRLQGGYKEEKYEAKTTQKEMYADIEYFGGANNENGDGYTVANVEAKDTQKQFLSDKEYYGGIGDQTQHMTMSYDDMYNACIDELKESTLVGRDPTQTSVKVASGSDAVNVNVKKIECDVAADREVNNRDRVVNEFTSFIDKESITREKQAYDISDRLDIDLLQPFKENPYTKPLDSVA